MGACNFSVLAVGQDARQAFYRAVADAQWEYGHGGYTGTIAEKGDYVVLKPPKDMDPVLFAQMVQSYWPGRPKSEWCPEGEPESCGYNGELAEKWNELSDTDKNAVREAYQATEDKWGPAGCIYLGNEEWQFFGYASH